MTLEEIFGHIDQRIETWDGDGSGETGLDCELDREDSTAARDELFLFFKEDEYGDRMLVCTKAGAKVYIGNCCFMTEGNRDICIGTTGPDALWKRLSQAKKFSEVLAMLALFINMKVKPRKRPANAL